MPCCHKARSRGEKVGKSGLGSRQFFILTFGLTVGTSILVTPSGLAATAREDAWLGGLAGYLINIGMAAMYIGLVKLFPEQNLFGMFEKAFGKWAGKAVSLLYLFYFLILAGTLLGNLGFFVTSEVLPDTPIDIVQILFLAACVMCAKTGIVVLARLGELMFPWILFFFMVLILALLPQIEWEYIAPMLEGGLDPVLKAGFHASMFQELIVMVVFVPQLASLRNWKGAFLGGMTFGHLLLVSVVLFSVLILGIEQSANSTFPAYALAKTISLGNFLQRIEGILIALWIMTFFLKTMMLFFSMMQGMKTILGLKSASYAVYPIAVVLLLVAWNTYVNSVYIGEVIQKVWGGYAMIHLVAIPFLMGASGLLRRRMKILSENAEPT
ncbi:endospore germination permease [Paenibacillus sp. PAMC21692]|nr:endospore germination permease [Paenibacillus sp. PAMC21692]